MSIELYLLVNLAADLALLCAVARALGCLDWRRLLAADALCAAYSVLAVHRPIPWSGPPVQLALLSGLSALVVGRSGLRLCGKAALLLCGGALLSGGASALIYAAGSGPAAAICAV
ncbi:MAG: sigma-E processing peptidase SpoIIGA, partial [Clostridia bacterium]|nr:sigma-E processing peptidase SpoIIGA [Clostridia bacterium]